MILPDLVGVRLSPCLLLRFEACSEFFWGEMQCHRTFSITARKNVGQLIQGVGQSNLNYAYDAPIYISDAPLNGGAYYGLGDCLPPL